MTPRSFILVVLGLVLLLASNNAVSAAPRKTRSPLAMGPVQIPGWKQQAMLAVINQARGTTTLPAANMKQMEWDNNLATMAQQFTNGCGCNWRRYDNAFLAWCDRMPDPVAVVKWRLLRMAPFYDFNTGQCINTTKSAEICRHPDNYEAMVYANTERVGCAMTQCWPDDGPKSLFHACIVGGTRPRQAGHPFTAGPRCSQCDTANGWKYCVDGLCSKTPPTNKPSMVPTTSKPTPSPTKFPTTRFPTTASPTVFPTRFPGSTSAPTRKKRG